MGRRTGARMCEYPISGGKCDRDSVAHTKEGRYYCATHIVDVRINREELPVFWQRMLSRLHRESKIKG